MAELTLGLTGSATLTVTAEHTASRIGSGELAVLATPVLCSLMEGAACNAIRLTLPEGMTSVGTSLTITHDRATAVGDKVVSTAILTNVKGRKLTFAVRAEDTKGPIGSGTHTRYIVDSSAFLAKVYED